LVKLAIPTSGRFKKWPGGKKRL